MLRQSSAISRAVSSTPRSSRAPTQFHGDVWEFFRNDKLNANQWENKFNGPGNELAQRRLCVGTCLVAPLAARSGKTSCSFSADYQGQRFDHPTTSKFITVFTNAERNGDFSQLTTQLKNPITGVPYVQQPDSHVADKPCGSGSVCVQVLSDADQRQPHQQRDQSDQPGLQHRPGRCQDRLEYHPERPPQRPLGAGISERPSDQLAGDPGQYRPRMLRSTMRSEHGPTPSAPTY